MKYFPREEESDTQQSLLSARPALLAELGLSPLPAADSLASPLPPLVTAVAPGDVFSCESNS